MLALPFSAQATQNILVFGDSLSAAYGIARDASWVSLMQQALKRSHPQYQVINASISGETTAGGIRRIEHALQQHQPTIVIIELGANDGLQGTAINTIEKNLSTLIKQSLKHNARVLLVGMQLPPNYGLKYTSQFRALYPTLAQRYKITLLPFLLKGLTPEHFQADNLHPNEAGQMPILQNVLPTLRPLLHE